jgi:D-glycero-beta-D-manno-heptose-7-phosphate kinase
MLHVPHYKPRPYQVLIVGDVMLDAHHYGRNDLPSAEAPINIFEVEKSAYNPGGAANVALNVKAMGGTPVLMGVIGKDEQAEHLKQMLDKAEVSTQKLYALRHVPTTLKSRFYVGSRQVFRSDRESKEALSVSATRHQFLHAVVDYLHQARPELVILQDYNKGVLRPDLSHAIIQQAKALHIPVLVDPKLDHLPSYRGAYLLKPNLKEWRHLTGELTAIEKENLDLAAARVMEQLQLKALMVTMSEQGLYYNDGSSSGILPGVSVLQPDVSGAGDTVIAAIAWSMSQGWSMAEGAEIANLAGAAACMKPGIQPVSWQEIRTLYMDRRKAHQ